MNVFYGWYKMWRIHNKWNFLEKHYTAKAFSVFCQDDIMLLKHLGVHCRHLLLFDCVYKIWQRKWLYSTFISNLKSIKVALVSDGLRKYIWTILHYLIVVVYLRISVTYIKEQTSPNKNKLNASESIIKKDERTK